MVQTGYFQYNETFVHCAYTFQSSRENYDPTQATMIEEKDEDGTASFCIHKQFQDLITSCYSAYAVEDKLDKERTVHADTFDALRMNLQYYSWNDK